MDDESSIHLIKIFSIDIEKLNFSSDNYQMRASYGCRAIGLAYFLCAPFLLKISLAATMQLFGIAIRKSVFVSHKISHSLA
jgi:hypothetical protein